MEEIKDHGTNVVKTWYVFFAYCCYAAVGIMVCDLDIVEFGILEIMNSSTKKSIAFKVSVFLIVTLALIGFGGFLAGFICSFTADSDYPKVSTKARFPLGDLQTAAVDSSGNIYCGSGFYSRIQAYSPEGKFIRGWFFQVGRGTLRMMIDGEDNIHIGTAKGDEHHIFTTDGKLLTTEGDMNAFNNLDKDQITDIDGNSYEILNSLILPRVSKTDAKGKKTVVVSDPFYLWFINGPLPVWLWMLVAILLGRGLYWLRKRNLI